MKGELFLTVFNIWKAQEWQAQILNFLPQGMDWNSGPNATVLEESFLNNHRAEISKQP